MARKRPTDKDERTTMNKLPLLALCSALALAACAPRPAVELGPDGQPLPVAYTITPAEEAQIGARLQANIATLRAGSGLAPLALNPQLSAAAAAHARDMSAQNRAWHFGSDGSSPLDRAKRAGYFGAQVFENISESYENDTATLNAWMQQRDTRDVIMDPAATQFGIGWFQEPSRKIWWVLVVGA